MEAPMTKYIRVDYTVKPDVDLDNLKVALTEFVAGIRSHHPEHRYTSFQHPADSAARLLRLGRQVREAGRRCRERGRRSPSGRAL
jgi:hypothetical protein